MNALKHIAAAALVAVSGIASVAHATVVESFSGGQLSTPGWTVGIGADASTFLSPAPDGTSGIYLSDSTWSLNPNIDFHVGEVLSAWINPGPSADPLGGIQGGRISIGVSSGNDAVYALTAASDTNQLVFQTVANVSGANPSFTEVASSRTRYGDQWYKLSVSWLASGITANLYDNDGSTLVGSVFTTQQPPVQPGAGNALALFGNGGAAITTLSVEPVPEPESFALLLAGLGLVGVMVQRRQKRSN